MQQIEWLKEGKNGSPVLLQTRYGSLVSKLSWVRSETKDSFRGTADITSKKNITHWKICPKHIKKA
jgi:hypothetical protein